MQTAVAYKSDCVDQEVGNDERHHTVPARVEPAEDHAHSEIAHEPTEALVEVVRAAKQSRCRNRGGGLPAQLLQPVQQVREDDHFFEHRVFQRRQQQNRRAPPLGSEVDRCDPHRGAHSECHEVQSQSADADDGRENQSAEQIFARLGGVDSQHPW